MGEGFERGRDGGERRKLPTEEENERWLGSNERNPTSGKDIMFCSKISKRY